MCLYVPQVNTNKYGEKSHAPACTLYTNTHTLTHTHIRKKNKKNNNTHKWSTEHNFYTYYCSRSHYKTMYIFAHLYCTFSASYVQHLYVIFQLCLVYLNQWGQPHRGKHVFIFFKTCDPMLMRMFMFKNKFRKLEIFINNVLNANGRP